jgi:hypothetical protein
MYDTCILYRRRREPVLPDVGRARVAGEDGEGGERAGRVPRELRQPVRVPRVKRRRPLLRPGQRRADRPEEDPGGAGAQLRHQRRLPDRQGLAHVLHLRPPSPSLSSTSSHVQQAVEAVVMHG